MRACIHDEATFLANQTIDVGRIEANVFGMLDHRIAERHRETLVHVHERLGALAGVDAAVPHLLLAGQIGSGKQFAVVHAARRV
ncbi:hypothetical protein SDC9_136245 [bioreactor metagenome]|uniref:Uncharacterized protein n=1 Tax=bioreactor metagenome TaxID=1076179 RepID=A0A645DIQ5_9ZZZZ